MFVLLIFYCNITVFFTYWYGTHFFFSNLCYEGAEEVDHVHESEVDGTSACSDRARNWMNLYVGQTLKEIVRSSMNLANIVIKSEPYGLQKEFFSFKSLFCGVGKEFHRVEWFWLPKVQKFFTNLNNYLIEPFFRVSDLSVSVASDLFNGYKSIKLKLLAHENQTVGKPWTKTQKIGNSRSLFSYRKEKKKTAHSLRRHYPVQVQRDFLSLFPGYPAF